MAPSLRDVLIPRMLCVAPRRFGISENDYAEFTDCPAHRLFVDGEGREWLELRQAGATVAEVGQRANAEGLRYRMGAVELFFVLAKRLADAEAQ